MGDFKLAASLEGHDDDIKAVVFPNPSLVVSASRDATVRLWKLQSSDPPAFDATLSSQGQGFINSLAYAQPSSKFPEGLVVSGGKDAIIDVRQPSKLPQDNADSLLLGHSGNVCALDVSTNGSMIVSGAWDHEGRVWEVGKYESTAVLQGHGASVWAVLSYDSQTIITGCADQHIRIFNPSGKLRKEFRGSSDVIRALCKLPAGHASGADFASAGNDGIIHFWTLDGKERGQLHGHENFIYSLAVLPGGELASSSEDRTVRIWKGDQCVQTITHPAISVWSVAVCPENGDIVTGASDRIVRVFSRVAQRQGDADSIKAFEDSVKSSSIPQQSVGNVNKEKLPGPEFLQQKSGTKDGQVQMIKETNGNVTAYQWSVASHEWVQVGTVVDSAGSSGVKTSFQGQDYDYVFDVDIEDGKPPLKLPYNVSQNPYEVARQFIGDNELPITYLDQVANFIVSNTQGATIGQQSQAPGPGSDPWGTESRYRPGEVGSMPTPQAPVKPPKTLPQTQYLTITTANLKVVQKKLEELNEQLISNGRKDVSLNPSDIAELSKIVDRLGQSSFAPNTSDPSLGPGAEIALRICTSWPPEYRIPGLDLLRLLAAASDATVTVSSSGSNTIVDALAGSDVFDPSGSINNTMLAIRTLANLFNSEAGRLVVDGEFDKIHKLVSAFLPSAPSAPAGGTNRNLTIAITTLFINYAVLFTSNSAATNQDRALSLLDDVVGIINKVSDSEALYRALVAAGTLLAMGEDLRLAAREVLDLSGALKQAESVGKEPRIKNVIKEIRDEMA